MGRKREGKGCICLLFCFVLITKWISKISSLCCKIAELGFGSHSTWSNFFIGFLKVSLVLWMYSSLGRWSQSKSDFLLFSLRMLVPGLGYFGKSCWKSISMGWRMMGSPEAHSVCPFYLFVCVFVVGVKAVDKPKLFSKGNAHCFFYFSHQNYVSETDFCNASSNSCTWPL